MESALTLEQTALRDSDRPQAAFEANAGAAAPPLREGKALMEATKAFTDENVSESWRHLGVAIVLTALSTAVAATSHYTAVRLGAAIVTGLLIVRLFIIYHDFMHGAVLRGSRLAKGILSVYGVLVLAPPKVWKETHNYHHAHTAQIVGSHIGSFPVVTVEMWKKLSARDRLKYRIVRHPLTILFGYVPIFMIGMCINSVRKGVVKYWDSAVALLLNWTLTAVLIWQLGFATAFFAYLLPLMVATAAGGYLFYAQHNFPEMSLQPRHEWTYAKAALESSSYMPMGPVMQWFTGNIGFHHVHHLNAQIPFYRLPEAMASMRELQAPGRTSLKPSDIVKCLSLKLWDPAQKKMVGYP